MTEKKRKVGRPKGSKSPRLKLKPENEKKSVQRQFRFTEAELSEIQEAAKGFGLTVSEFFRRAALEKAELIHDNIYQRRFQFLRERLDKNDSDIIKTAIYSFYETTFNAYQYVQAEAIREKSKEENKPLIEDLLKALYGDLGDEKAVKEYMNHLDVPPYGKSWKLGVIRKMLRGLGIL